MRRLYPRLVRTYVIVLPLEPVTRGQSFHRSAWPLHVTTVGNFRTEATPDAILDRVERAVAGRRPISIRASGRALFGPESTIEVALLEKPDPVIELHRTLLAALAAVSIRLDFPDYSGSGFRPHITVMPHGRAKEGDRFELRRLALVEMIADRDDPAWKVLGTLNLG